MVKRGEALNDGLPRDNVAQDDQIMGGVGQMSLDPLGRERVLKCLCYHGMDLCLGCRETPFRHYPTDGYPLKAGQLTYDCSYSTMHGMPVTDGRGFRGLKLLWYNGVPP